MLVKECLAGDRQAFAEIVRRYETAMYRLAYAMAGNREDAEDMCRDCFLHLYQILPKYRPEYPFAAWFKRVATNRYINDLRSARRRASTTDYLEELGPGDINECAGTHDLENCVIRRAESQRVLEAVNALPTNLRIPIVLRYLEDLSFKEISAILHLPLGTVSTRVRRGTELLRQAIHAEGG